jgi:hypothetical protein
LATAASAFLLTFGSLAAPAAAIEMFTNFNNGTELGTRPLGIDEMPPVRFHSWQGRWGHGPMGGCFNPSVETSIPRSDMSGDTAQRPIGVPGLAGRGRVKAALDPDAQTRRGLQPTVVEPTERRSGHRPDARTDGDWLRSSNFLPPAESN